MFIASHPDHAALTGLSYEPETGHIVVLSTHPTRNEPERTYVPLARFLREIGVPFAHARAASQSTDAVEITSA